MEHILVVDDEAHIGELLNYNLSAAGYRVTVAETGEEALQLIAKELPDLILLDLMLPGIDGLEVCRRLKANPVTRPVPIIMLTARSEEMDKVVGLELGADDYVTKPFGVRELVARVKAMLRRVANTQPEPTEQRVREGGLFIDPERYEVRLDGKRLDLTPKEFELIKLMAGSKGRVWTREQLLDQVWGYDYFGETRTVDVHIRHLRQKLGDVGERFIKTVRGVGYHWVYREDES